MYENVKIVYLVVLNKRFCVKLIIVELDIVLGIQC